MEPTMTEPSKVEAERAAMQTLTDALSVGTVFDVVRQCVDDVYTFIAMDNDKAGRGRYSSLAILADYQHTHGDAAFLRLIADAFDQWAPVDAG